MKGPLRRPVKTTRILSLWEGLVPIASGANSVASALGSRTRRDPGTAVRTYHEGLDLTLETGTSYLAGNRNFLFGPDIRRSAMAWPKGSSRSTRERPAGCA